MNSVEDLRASCSALARGLSTHRAADAGAAKRATNGDARRDQIDREVYAAAGRPWHEPVLYGGDPSAEIGFFGRDPGREEVKRGEPLVGAGGKLVRAGIERAHLASAFLTNTVPYKPEGNIAWSTAVKLSFRPLIQRLLVDVWQGHRLITLGNEAFHWFGLQGDRELIARMDQFWGRDDRYTAEFEVVLQSPGSGRKKTITLLPLPHPSPLNAKWYRRFPELLDGRLKKS
ncbi:MAG TPA: uracil-DNA glycosylase family protein [Bdellovibrionota bacterium]|nr:uracil-DNA glycosylase family protein [Bdellovibrionota bacterium]